MCRDRAGRVKPGPRRGGSEYGEQRDRNRSTMRNNTSFLGLVALLVGASSLCRGADSTAAVDATRKWMVAQEAAWAQQECTHKSRDCRFAGRGLSWHFATRRALQQGRGLGETSRQQYSHDRLPLAA